MGSVSDLRIVANDNDQASLRICLEPIIRIRDGAWNGICAFLANEFEDWSLQHCHNPALPADQWLGLAIEQIGRAIQLSGLEERPVCVLVPYMAMMHPKSPDAALRGAKRAGMKADEFRLEFSNASIILANTEIQRKLAAFSRAGFRLGLDARTGLQLQPDNPILQNIEALRLDAHTLDLIEPNPDILQKFAEQGHSLYAENSLWPGAMSLRKWNISGVVAPFQTARLNQQEQESSAPPYCR